MSRVGEPPTDGPRSRRWTGPRDPVTIVCTASVAVVGARVPGSNPTPKAGRPSWVDDERAIESGTGPSSAADLVLAPGAVLAGKYRLTRPAGFGGMAQLWVAVNASTNAEVCVKVLVPEASDDESVKRFRREAHAAARLSHRAIVRVFDLVELDEQGEASRPGKKPKALAIVMELLAGETLGDVLMKRGKLPLAEALDLAVPVLSALAHAHRAGVVHRDIKPDNVFLAKDPDGHVTPKVLDFGISKLQGDKSQLTNDGVMLGTPSFMSPEQARGASKVDARSDVFSAAILLSMMLTGQNPFEAETFHAVIEAILEREVPRIPELPDAIWQVLDKALAKDPNARYADATELGIALRRASGRQVVTESGPASGRVALDSAVSVPPVAPGTTSEEAIPAAEESDLDVAGLPPAGGGIARLGLVAAVAAVVAVVAVLGVRAFGGASSSSQPSRAASQEAPTATPSAKAPAKAPATEALPAPAASPSVSAAVGTEKPPASAVPSSAPRPGPRRTAPARPSAAAPTAASSSAPVQGGHEPSIVRDPGF